MKKNLAFVSSLALAVLASSAVAFAGRPNAAPVPVSQFDGQAAVPSLDSLPVARDADGNELIDETPVQIERDMQDAADAARDSDLGDDQNDARIKFDPSKAAGKIIIRVHKSTDTAKKPEYLEVFKQKSADADDLEPQKLFDKGTSNRALVSTAGRYNGKQFVTPIGSFNLDSMEVMHHSSAYNNAPMPWSQFFNGGIALHGATPDEFKLLGHKASHGCVRIHPDNAKLLFAFDKAQGKSTVVVQVLDN
jgi:lipoprotein-anchoring transpeptidase ErfK/SrfK